MIRLVEQAELRGERAARRRSAHGGVGLVALVWCLISAIYPPTVTGAASSKSDEAIAGAVNRVEFDIPSQPLVAALQAYCNTAGVQVLYESDSALGYNSKAVVGTFTREAALRLLLTDTDLIVRYTNFDAITIARLSDRDLAIPPDHPLGGADLSLDTLRVQDVTTDASQLQDYTAAIQTDIQSALKKNAKLRGGNYSIEVRLWIDGLRTIEKAELLRSTGDRERDATISGTLQGLVISQTAPANTPQPVRVMIVVRSL